MAVRLRHILFGTILAFAAISAASCSGGENTGERYSVSIVGGGTVDYTAAKVTLSILSDVPWNVTVYYENEAETGQWCTLNSWAGNGIGSVSISVEENTAAERSAIVTVHFGSEKREVRLTQKAYRGFSGGTGHWDELPWFDRGGEKNVKVVTHFVPGRGDMRNFTICYDTAEHYPRWVAYPMHKSYYPSGSRTNAWQYDPKLPHEYQPDLSRGISGYTRGHMLGSASRYINSEANEQTFYFTNMAAQSSGFNGLDTAWTDLESRERGWGGTGLDTLYSVSGAVLRTVDGNESVRHTTSRDDDKPIAVPNYFYKALVKRFASGHLRGIAFWLPHGSYPRDIQASDAVSIEEVERLTGLDFFAALPDDLEEIVEGECDPSLWGL